MKLDPRIIEGKRPLTPFDTEEAKPFVCKDCYFAYNYTSFRALQVCSKGPLTAVDDKNDMPFVMADGFGGISKLPYIIPCEWVKQEEHWRPYTFEEFLARFQVGERIRYRKKDNPDYDIIEVLSVMRINQKNNEISVRLSCGDYDLQGLFDTFEIFEIFDCESSSADFTPFGVKE